ncbi:MAG: DUF6526 family protein [Acidobacteria bacterium]|nr:DUF6526 family protein [Acidobacteriota bacterium]
MPAQSYKNHERWDPWYHFFLSPVMLLNVVYWGMRLVREPDLGVAWGLVVSCGLVVAVLKLRLNALRVQDRLIRLEEQTRVRRLLGSSDASWVDAVSVSQWIGLRFASDGEVVALARRALEEKMEAKEIKEAIRDWRPDEYRV